MLTWYINRFRTMNLKEIFYRLKNKMYFLKLKNKNLNINENISINFIKLPLCYYKTDYVEKILNEANNIIKNNVHIFGQSYSLNENKKYITDPITKKKWMCNYFTKINYRKDDVPGDPKLIWEINKQQFLVNLGIAYQIEKNNKYAEKILIEINQWIEENPQYMGINWVSGLEMCLKNISWMYSLSLIKDYILINNIDLIIIKDSLFKQADFIYHKLSLYSSANNHLIGELLFLLYCSYFLDCSSSMKWRKKSKKLLDNQILKQFYKDGINTEQSINYQLHTMEMYFLSEYILNLHNDKLDYKVKFILSKACNYINTLSDYKGDIFNIGDDDGGSILKILDGENKILSILQFGSVILDENKYIKDKKKYFDIKLFMLFGEKYSKFFNSLKEEKLINKEKLFKYGGMYINKNIVNNRESIFCLDFGKSGLQPLYAHAHNDILSFNFIYKGQFIFIDSGTYKYYLCNGFRKFFRGVASHNTISIDNKNQFKILGPFMCGKSPNTKLVYYKEKEIEVLTDAYKSSGCLVKRKVEIKDNLIIITDSIKVIDKKKHTVNIFFNLNDNITLDLLDKNGYKLSIKNEFLYLVVDKKLKTNLFAGYDKDNIKYGWISNMVYKIGKTNEIVCVSENVNIDIVYKSYILFNYHDYVKKLKEA